MTESDFDTWDAGQSYEHYMGRWSRRIAAEFVDWLDAPHGLHWVEIGCGTGALTEAVLRIARPTSILATDPSEGFVRHARAALDVPRVRFEVGTAAAVPADAGTADAVVLGLALNFVPDRGGAFAEFGRVLRPCGTMAFYVWDYPGGGIGFIDAFWKAAAELDPGAAALDEAGRFPDCTEAGVSDWCREAGLDAVEVRAIETATAFEDFEAFWRPFTLGAGPAPGYCAALTDDGRAELKSLLGQRIGQGPVSLTARAWAAKGRTPA